MNSSGTMLITGNPLTIANDAGNTMPLPPNQWVDEE
jgi:hypothetical protein